MKISESKVRQLVREEAKKVMNEDYINVRAQEPYQVDNDSIRRLITKLSREFDLYEKAVKGHVETWLDNEASGNNFA
jgi:hypothetical protein